MINFHLQRPQKVAKVKKKTGQKKRKNPGTPLAQLDSIKLMAAKWVFDALAAQLHKK